MQSNTGGSVTECTFRIRTQEVNSLKRLKTSSLIMLMQEASMENALRLKVSVWDLSEEQLSWVILRKEVQIIKPPILGDTIVIKTYPADFDRVLAYRDFWVYNQDGELIACAASTWALMNMVTRKMHRVPPDYSKWVYKGEKLAILPSKLKISGEVDSQYNYVIRMGDLDWNNHVNNIVLSKLMIQSAPEQFFREKRISKFTFHIKSECLLNEEIQISCKVVDAVETHHRVISMKDERLVALAKCEWQWLRGQETFD